ncbi:DNA repair helicase XPB [Paenibacillus sp. MBLB4367]|uniref:DNA repair helicase XPB n=1 Tax=Paenibacillus sp. MBLB4367 TaxID=3384767 RepID=UPI0039081BEA
MKHQHNAPLFVQNDMTVLLEAQHPRAETVSMELCRFAELVKSPNPFHTYRLTPLSLWNAAASGLTAEQLLVYLNENGKLGVPASVKQSIEQAMNRYGLLRMVQEEDKLLLVSDDPGILFKIASYPSLQPYLTATIDTRSAVIDPVWRGKLKQELTRLGYPVEDKAGYHQGETLPVRLNAVRSNGSPFVLRDYQRDAVDAFYRGGANDGGSGVLVLPCGAGKTVIGIAAMEKCGCATLILTTNVTSVRQWRDELLDKTDLTPDMIGEYNGTRKEVRPVTIATYQILTHRRSKNDAFSHMHLFQERDWGLIIYDEAHLLPAPVFRVTAEIQATRRLGLTATLVREDGCEEDVFSLVGPKRFDMPWKRLEQAGWIAKAVCSEIKIGMPEKTEERYRHAGAKDKLRIAAENEGKWPVLNKLLQRHAGEPTLVIGQYLNQLQTISERTGAPLLSGTMPHDERDRLYRLFREGELTLLIVSKVANFAVDLPDASVAVQVSGSFGSRQEEAQRLGRVLRPKADGKVVHFYSLVSERTREEEFALNRQLFLVEQGYRYELTAASDVLQDHRQQSFANQRDEAFLT